MTQEEVRSEIIRLVNNNLSYRKAQNMIAWLDSVGFFEAPASSKYHLLLWWESSMMFARLTSMSR